MRFHQRLALRSKCVQFNENPTSMQLQVNQTDENSLRALADEAVELLLNGKFEKLAERFGYAVALGRSAVEAIKSDLAQALAQVSANRLLADTPPELSVVFYEPNSVGLRAAVSCKLQTDTSSCISVDLVVAGTDQEQFITLESIDPFDIHE